MKQLRRHGMAVALALAVAAGVVPSVSAQADDRYAGFCTLSLSADQSANGSTMAVTTITNVCNINGTDAEVELTGNLEPAVSGRPFSCGDKIGTGSVDVSFQDDPESTEEPLVVDDAAFRVADVFGVVSGSALKETGEQHLAGTFHGDRSPSAAACDDEDEAVTWTVVLVFEMRV